MFSFLSAIAPIMLGSSVALAAVVQDYQYPKISANLATISSALIASPGAKFETLELDLIPARRSNPFFSGRTKYAVDVFMPTPGSEKGLVYVIGGLGAGEAGAISRAYAVLLQKDGYVVVTVASPFSWQHSLRASQDGLVGYLPKDARESAHALLKLDASITKGKKLDRYVLGYSLGALATPHLTTALDEVGLNVKKSLMINPPVKLSDSIQKLDDLYKIREGMTAEKIRAIESYVIGIGAEALTSQVVVDENFAKKYPISREYLIYMISKSFRDSLFEIVFTSQSVTDLGILKAKASKLSREDRYVEARRYSFFEYVQKFLYPQLLANGETRSLEKVMYDISIEGSREKIVNDKRFFLMHNMDDFLILDQDTKDFLYDLPGDMTLLYPRGGHMGNVQFQRNQKDILDIFNTKTRN